MSFTHPKSGFVGMNCDVCGACPCYEHTRKTIMRGKTLNNESFRRLLKTLDGEWWMANRIYDLLKSGFNGWGDVKEYVKLRNEWIKREQDRGTILSYLELYTYIDIQLTKAYELVNSGTLVYE